MLCFRNIFIKPERLENHKFEKNEIQIDEIKKLKIRNNNCINSNFAKYINKNGEKYSFNNLLLITHNLRRILIFPFLSNRLFARSAKNCRALNLELPKNCAKPIMSPWLTEGVALRLAQRPQTFPILDIYMTLIAHHFYLHIHG